jgi:anti-anti-sigma factor
MEINLLEQNGEKIVAIKGRVDTITASDLETAVSEIWSIPSTTLVFDCSEMDYISSSGLRVVIKAHKQVTAVGGKFIMRNLNREVRTVIDLTGFSRILVIE